MRSFGVDAVIRVLTVTALAGLLFGVGLRLTLDEVSAALRRCRIVRVLLLNFVAVPALAVLLVRALQLDLALATGTLLLAAAPFAPVVPVFTRLARGDLALAAGLTALVPVLSAGLTPPVVALSLRALAQPGEVRLSLGGAILTLLGSILVPLAIGVAVRRLTPAGAGRMRRPVEVVAEAAGALSLAFVTATEFGAILASGWRSVLAIVLLSEMSLAIGWWAGGPARATRQVVALGTSNRNIALALLLALANFGGTPVVPAVVANGLLLILLGLVHVAWWRFGPGRRPV
jgi:BASS family bile acid:Na+ symporter